uniref:Dickkopf-related protein 2-like n=1 Tax=Callorhinchus milii TaxID=7868 RepID=A0A4W3HAR7_CALMI
MRDCPHHPKVERAKSKPVTITLLTTRRVQLMGIVQPRPTAPGLIQEDKIVTHARHKISVATETGCVVREIAALMLFFNRVGSSLSADHSSGGNNLFKISICIIELQISKVIKRVPQRLVYEADDDLDIILGNKNRSNTRTSPSATKGLEGDPCLRSSDCLSGFCCSRHLWSKMCKPLLQEDEVCTKHRRKGARVLEIYERCNCEKGLTCQTLQDPGAAIKARLSTCQKH